MAFRHFHAKRPLLLAADLDGTFVGGPPEDRRALYALIHAHRHAVRLLFCTGHSFEKVRTLGDARDLPSPDAMICDVGTSVFGPQGNVPFDDLHHDAGAMGCTASRRYWRTCHWPCKTAPVPGAAATCTRTRPLRSRFDGGLGTVAVLHHPDRLPGADRLVSGCRHLLDHALA